ncbi:hypothetical protein [Kitasatospora paranensis]|uniref:Uncharacterized protein n=1 Tax=Kitasatospora paranensis TaxID=258053 RepID=A0ABW2G717_9ACTN
MSKTLIARFSAVLLAAGLALWVAPVWGAGAAPVVLADGPAPTATPTPTGTSGPGTGECC